ncbi:MAG: DNA primase, partial [Phycisphaerae bacterium]
MPDAETGAITRQIQQATNIVDLIGQYVALKPAGANHKGLCPFHNEKTPSFYVSASKQIFKCFGCGAGGDVFTFLQLREGISFAEARAWLAQRAGIRLEPTSQDRPAGPDQNALARVNDWAARFFRRQLLEPGIGAVARQYLAGRKISQQTAEAFGLGYAPDRWDGLLTAAQARGISTGLLAAAGLIRPRSGGEGFYDTFRHRLIFPIRDLPDRVIGFGGRTLGDDSAKYINSPETVLFEKGRNLYGLDLAKQPITRAGQAVIVEGYTDCLMAHQHGLAQTVATLGTALTEAHVQVLRRFADRAVVVFDPDEAGQRAADRALEV